MQPVIADRSTNRSMESLKKIHPHTVPVVLLLACSGLLLCMAAAAAFGWNRPLRASGSPAAAADRPLRFMTYNIRHAEGLDGHVRLSEIRRQLERGGADVIALQEVDRYRWRSGLQDQVSALAKSLRMYYAYSPAVRHGLSQYGIALLSRYPLDRVRTYLLPGGNGTEPRTVLTAQLKLGPERPMTLLTTHLGVTRRERELQMPALLAILHAVETPLVVLGDFNMPDSDPLVNGLHLMLVPVPLESSQATLAYGGQADHIYTSMDSGSMAWVQASPASDHLPVFCQLDLSAIR
ncbi:endonuclease/exonuclease/phosphatase family protein [Paenibacillus piri]|uniref:Endonuclease/exonuclease/phosphatase domain-containing protein n=1 Tax=Paenibacillus piri TaxID=2547395 RepID=A0A4R5KL23_9BACL|nr:endonuclease/exonuclease/phosphatase family protein [Paenibacillus piri]TDF96186.1 hypothetical protein E1757_17460 [Paenibacillus piri]